MGKTTEMAKEHPEAVRAVAERVDDPLSSKLFEILENVEGDGK